MGSSREASNTGCSSVDLRRDAQAFQREAFHGGEKCKARPADYIIRLIGVCFGLIILTVLLFVIFSYLVLFLAIPAIVVTVVYYILKIKQVR